MPEIILPGTYVTVRDEGLVTAGRVVTGNIGIVGTAEKGPLNEVKIIGSFTEAQELFGQADEDYSSENTTPLTLMRAIELIFNNGGRTVYAVRTAQGAPLETQLTFTSTADKASVILKARSAGTWGNSIKVTFGAAEQGAVVKDVLRGNATKLNRTTIKNSKVNSVILQQKATGLNLSYVVKYAAVNNANPEVFINPTTGALTFTTLETHIPKAEDTLIVRYELPTKAELPSSTCQKVTFTSGNVKESYIVADASNLAEQVNQRSTLFKSLNGKTDESAFFNDPLVKMTTINGSNGAAAVANDYRDSLAKIENEQINIVLLAGQDATKASMMAVLAGHINKTADTRRERIALVGCNGTTDVNEVAQHDFDSDRIIYVGPGIQVSPSETMPGSYTAAALAGLLSSLPVHISPTNKVLTLPGLNANYSSSQLEKLVLNRVLAVEKRNGFRIVKGITTATNSAWHQITTRRIVDYAIYGVRSGCNPYIGKLNNERVRGAMKATLDAFLTRMVEDEAMVSYDLAVTANRAQEIAGEAIVTMTLRPTFSIDFIRVTMYLG